MTNDIDNTVCLYLDHFPDEHDRMADFLIQYGDDSKEILKRSNMKGHITTSMVVISNDLRSMLLIKHKGYGIWLQPGGHYEGDGTLVESALRELQEETGVSDVEVVLPFPVDIDTHDIPARPAKNEGEHRHYDFCYLAIADRNCKLTAQEDEVDGVQWVPIDDLMNDKTHLGILALKALVTINTSVVPF